MSILCELGNARACYVRMDRRKSHAFFVFEKKRITYNNLENDMRRFLTLISACLALVLPTVAQDMKVIDFHLLDKDLTANTRGTSKLDQNGETAALIKIVTPERGFIFDGGTLGIVATEEHVGETWIYVPRRAMKLIIHHKDYGVLRDYIYPVPIEGGRTYEMFLDLGIGRYVTITSQIAKSTIYIDGENCGEAPIHNRYLSYGRHTVRAVKDRYEGEQTVIITTTDEQERRIINIDQCDMSDHFGNVTVTVDNNAEIWYDGKNVGTGSWKTQLREGNYVVETHKANCDPQKTSFAVIAQRQNTVHAAQPTPHTGRLGIYTMPRDVVATYNGTNPIDLTQVNTLPVGTYQLSLSRKGYYSKTGLQYTVKHNTTTTDTVTLSRVNYIQPKAFYFGLGYSLASLGGVTAVVGAVYQNHDLQLGYTFGLQSSDAVSWYTTDGNMRYMSSMTYKRSVFSVKYGYQVELTERLGLVPQVGYAMERLAGTVDDGKNTYGDGSMGNSLTLGAKLLFAPVQGLYLFANPEFGVGISKDGDFTRIADSSDIAAGGFVVTVGAILNFKL